MNFTLNSVKSDHILDSFVVGDTKYEITSCYLNDQQAGRVAKIIESMPHQINLADVQLESSEELVALSQILRSFKISTTGKRGSWSFSSPIREIAISPLQSPSRMRIEYSSNDEFELILNALRVKR